MFSKVFAVLLALSTVVMLAGCGGSSSPRFAPPPTGSFTNASLSGTYALSVSGTNQFGPLMLAGSVKADGNGNLTSGALDINSGGGVSTNVPVTGTYSVGADGRGLATLNATAISSSFTFDFVIVSNTRALAMRFDSNSTATGSFDKQDSTAFATGMNGQYAFTLSGIGASGNAYQTAGLFAASGGTLSNGLQDTNNAGSITAAAALSGTYTGGDANGRGTLTLATSTGILNFAFYVVDATHVKVIETDAVPSIAGDAYRQSGTFSNSSLNGPFAFTVGGGLTAPFVAGGVFSADGNGTITSGVQDLNSGGSIAQNLSSTGSYSIASTGRGTLTLTNSVGTFNYAVYPSAGGLLMLELDSSLPASGTAFAQAGTPSTGAISGNYGYSLTGVSLGTFAELESIAKLSASGGQFTGAADFNFFEGSGFPDTLSRSLALSGPFSFGSNGRGTATLTSSNGSQSLALYFVDGSRVLFVELDSSVVGVGDFEVQQ